MTYSLYIDSVNKRRGDKLILSDIFLTCKTKEIVGLLGRNGSGKSTLMKIIFGTETAENKFIKVNDEPIFKKLYKIKDFINFLPQENILPLNLTVREVINYCVAKASRELLIGNPVLKKIIDTKIKNLSGGELKLQLKTALNSEAKFILLDEPFSGVAPILIEEIKSEILEASQKKGIIISDHNYEEIMSISTKTYLLKDGKNHIVNDVSELKSFGYINSI